MANAIKIGEIANEIANTLSGYTVQVADGVKAAVDETMKELVADTKKDAPERSGRYKKAIASKVRYESEYEKRLVWYVKKPYFALSHLLEKGHAKRGGGRVKAYPHIEKNRENAATRFTEHVKEVIRNAGK